MMLTGNRPSVARCKQASDITSRRKGLLTRAHRKSVKPSQCLRIARSNSFGRNLARTGVMIRRRMIVQISRCGRFQLSTRKLVNRHKGLANKRRESCVGILGFRADSDGSRGE